MVLHALEQDLDRLAAEVGRPVRREGVGFVDEQDPTQRLLDHLARLDRRLAHEPGHQARAVHLDQLPLRQGADRLVQPAQQPRHRRLARAGVALEDHVQRERRHRQARLLAQPPDLHQVHQAVDLPLDLVQAAQTVQLRHQLLERALRRGLRLLRRGGRGRGLLRGGAVPLRGPERGVRRVVGDVGRDGEGRAVARQAVLVALDAQDVQIALDRRALVRADAAVHRREEQQEQRERLEEAPRDAPPRAGVVLAHLLEEGRRGQVRRGVALPHEVPEEDRRRGRPVAVDGVPACRVAGREGRALGVPDGQGAAARPVVRVAADGDAQAGVRQLAAEGGEQRGVFLVEGSGVHGGQLLHFFYLIIRETAGAVKIWWSRAGRVGGGRLTAFVELWYNTMNVSGGALSPRPGRTALRPPPGPAIRRIPNGNQTDDIEEPNGTVSPLRGILFRDIQPLPLLQRGPPRGRGGEGRQGRSVLAPGRRGEEETPRAARGAPPRASRRAPERAPGPSGPRGAAGGAPQAPRPGGGACPPQERPPRRAAQEDERDDPRGARGQPRRA